MNPATFATILLSILLSSACGAPSRVTNVEETHSAPEVDHRIACLGDSITYGSGIDDRLRASWPALLGYSQGNNVEVRNFGVSGATLLKRGDKPIWKQKAFGDAQAWWPDIVILLLGTNDSKLANMQHIGGFEADLKGLIHAFRDPRRTPSTRVLLCLPPPAWRQGSGIDGTRIHNEIIPRIRHVALAERCEIIDLNTPLLSHERWFPDGVHPDPFGAEFIARRVSRAIGTRLDEGYDIFRSVEDLGQEGSGGEFEGFRRLDFSLAARQATIVQPHITAQGRPWIWRARFLGHEPQFDRAMLERGWHVVHIDTAGLYGNHKAMEIWDGFYERLVKGAGLSEKPVIEAMSRGGLIAYDWAKAHPTQVAGVYGDNAVCNPLSWPGGAGTGKGSPTDWKRYLQAHGLTEERASREAGFATRGLESLAKKRVPLFNLVGLADQVVPPADNTDLLAAAYRRLGGDIEVMTKPGVGHHPHSLPDPTPMVEFALRSIGQHDLSSVQAVPSVEFRGKSAGWGGGTWWDQHYGIKLLTDKHRDIELVFLGDSITQGLTGAQDRLSHAGGKRTFDRYFGKYKAAGFGISGDRTEHILFRIRDGNLDLIEPKLIVLMIGVNNLGQRQNTGREVAAGTRQIAYELLHEQPQARILLLGCLPSTSDPDSWRRRQIDVVHDEAQKLAKEDRITYLDLRRAFLQPDGRIDPRLMRKDEVHLTAAGIEEWAAAMAPTIDELMGRPIEQEKQPEWLTRTVAVRPSEQQVAWQRREFTCFIHFGVNTFTDREWGTGKEDPAIFAPTALDTDQWVRVAKDAGMKMMILTAKHHDGFCLWPSRYTTHSVASSPWKQGKGDVMKELARSCREQGLELGVYLSPADLYQIENAKGLYGNGSTYTERTIPRPVPGRPFADERSFRYEVDDYNEYYMNQLFELLTEYGPIHEVWLDGAHPKRKGGQTYTYRQWYDLVHELAPQAVIFGKGPGCRWIGNEAGGSREEEWSVIPLPVPAEEFAWGDMTAQDLGSRARIRDARYFHWYPAEMDTSIRRGWFYHAKEDGDHKSTLPRLLDVYRRGVGGNAVLLLNVPPDRRGRIHEIDARRLARLGKHLRETFGTNLAAGATASALLDSEAHPAAHAVDGDLDTWWQPAPGVNRTIVTVTLPHREHFNLVSLQEQIRQGQRIEGFVVEAWTGRGWAHLRSGRTIGHKKLLRFADVRADKLRIHITSSRCSPTLAEIGVFLEPKP